MGMVLGGLVLIVAAASQAPTTIDRIVAVVDGDLITLSDVRAARVLKLAPADAADQAVVEMLVERRLVLAEMRRFQTPDPSPGDLAARRTEWAGRFDGADPEALFTLAGVTPAFLDRWLADDLRREAYLRQRFAALDAVRRAEAIRLWIESLRTRADIVYRGLDAGAHRPRRVRREAGGTRRAAGPPVPARRTAPPRDGARRRRT